MFKRKLKLSPLTKGQALIQARELLGSNAAVVRDKELCIVGLFPFNRSGHDCGVGASWEEALELAKADPLAEAWENYKEGRRNDFLDAVNSLRDTARALLGDKKLAQHLTREDRRFIRTSLGNLA